MLAQPVLGIGCCDLADPALRDVALLDLRAKPFGLGFGQASKRVAHASKQPLDRRAPESKARLGLEPGEHLELILTDPPVGLERTPPGHLAQHREPLHRNARSIAHGLEGLVEDAREAAEDI